MSARAAMITKTVRSPDMTASVERSGAKWFNAFDATETSRSGDRSGGGSRVDRAAPPTGGAAERQAARRGRDHHAPPPRHMSMRDRSRVEAELLMNSLRG